MAEPIPLVVPSLAPPVPPVSLASPSPVIPGMSSVVSLPNAIPSNGTTIPVVPLAPAMPAQNTSVGALGVPGNTITLTSTLSVTSSLSVPSPQDSGVVPPLPVPIAVVSSSAVPSQDRPNMDQVISSDRARESSLAGVLSPSQVSLPVTSSTTALSLTLQIPSSSSSPRLSSSSSRSTFTETVVRTSSRATSSQTIYSNPYYSAPSKQDVRLTDGVSSSHRAIASGKSGIASIGVSASLSRSRAVGDVNQTATAPSSTTATYVTAGTTLTGPSALIALAASASSVSVSIAASAASVSASRQASSSESENGATTKDGGSALSNFAIVGIVGGILAALIIAYVVWYQWRRRRVKKASKDDQEVVEEKTYDEDGRTVRSSFGDDPFDDGRTPYGGQTWYSTREPQDRQTVYEGDDYYDERANRREEDPRYPDHPGELEYLDEDDLYDDPQNHQRAEYGLSTYGDGLTAAIMDDGRTARYDSPPTHPTTPEATHDPFKPRPPASRSSIPDTQATRELVPPSRPFTQASRAESYGYGDIYDGYDDSRAPTRPATQFQDGPETSYFDPMTPATSNLLPWLGPDRSPPPVPQHQPRQMAFQQYEPDERRQPPAAVLARPPDAYGTR